MKADKDTIIAALYNWVAKRPGLEYVNYGGVTTYRAEMRRITQQRHDAEAMIRYCHIRDSITADDLRSVLVNGRLTWTEDGKGGGSLDYCAEQYWCVEYRAAVCRALSNLLYSYLRKGMPSVDRAENVRRASRREFGAGIALRWFR